TVTLRQLLATWVAHDLGHLVQVSRVLARQYQDAVGPWRAYLSVMR
ncbi:MAG: DinB family protein, partial [Acidobacteria bacterium]|nr:DinB family protein [Acidobacteriota bacterium]